VERRESNGAVNHLEIIGMTGQQHGVARRAAFGGQASPDEHASRWSNPSFVRS
jgi:hypothetical protein